MFIPLTTANLTLEKEKTYFWVLAIVSSIVWALVLISVVGIPFLLGGLLFGWIAQGLLIARLRSESVKIGPEQLPELSNTLVSVCGDLGLEKQPALYVLQSGGILNAFATRFAARDFVVLNSDALEAYGETGGEIRFLLGHEIGHVRSKHVLKHMFVAPGSFLPLIGSAYNRACESSCDRHGAFASHDAAGSVRAMMVLSGGKNAGKGMNPTTFSGQYHEERGFFVSLHELFSSYPTLSRRVANLQDLQEQRETPAPGRHPLAWLLALFCPGARYGVFGMIMVIYVLAIFAGVALPVFTKAKQKAEQVKARQEMLRREAETQ